MRTMTILCAAAGVLLSVGCMDRDEDNQSRSPSSNDKSNSWKGEDTTASEGAGTISDTDRNFVKQAASGGMFEVKSSELALQRLTMRSTQDEQGRECREFAQRLVDDHGKVNKELKALAKKKDIAISDRMQPKQQRAYDKLNGLSDKDFNKQYYEDMVEAHDDAIELFQKASREARDEGLREFALRTLPTLQEHRMHLQDNEKVLKGD